jgi:hypothetical protein
MVLYHKYGIIYFLQLYYTIFMVYMLFLKICGSVRLCFTLRSKLPLFPPPGGLINAAAFIVPALDDADCIAGTTESMRTLFALMHALVSYKAHA